MLIPILVVAVFLLIVFLGLTYTALEAVRKDRNHFRDLYNELKRRTDKDLGL